MELESCGEERPVKRRQRRDPNPRYLSDISAQLDVVHGCPQLQVSGDHLARRIQQIVGELDVAELHGQYSSLGRRGHNPQWLLAVWVYASATGLHHASKVERACKTDAAFRLLTGGRTPSAATLKRFRLRHGDFFRRVLEQTVALAHQREMLEVDELAADSMRLRADSSMQSVRRKSTAEQRLKTLEQASTQSMTAAQQQAHEQALSRNAQVFDTCCERGVSSYVKGNELAGLIKFPHGGAMPGHRLTVTAAGVSERIVIGVLIDGSANDCGKLRPSLQQTLQVLEQVGVEPQQRVHMLADAGYWDSDSLQHAQVLADRVEVCIAEGRRPKRAQQGRLEREQFELSDDLRSAVCPAGRPMSGPESAGRGKRRWFGEGCDNCSLKPKCTSGKRRKLEIRPDYEISSRAMRARMASAETKARYAKRPAIIEPVFAAVQSEMGYRRASSRDPRTVIAEVLLKLLTHNIRRLLAADARLCVLWLTLDPSQSDLRGSGNRF